MMEDNLEELHEDKFSCDISLREKSDCGLINKDPLKIQNVEVFEIVDPLLSGAAISDSTIHNEGDTLQWHDMITDWFEDSSMMSHHSQEIGVMVHDQANYMIATMDGSHTSIFGHENIRQKRTDFIYFGIERVMRSKEMIKKWMRKAQEAKLVAANARRHLQKFKAKVTLINISRQKRINNIRRLLESKNTCSSKEDDEM
jgi:hypothetical protein